MTTYAENLAIAQSVCNTIKQKTICANDIIPKKNLPFLTLNPQVLSNAAQQHGMLVGDLLAHGLQLTKVKEALNYASKQYPNMAAGVSSYSIAMTRFGVGEAQDLVNLAIYELMKQGCLDVTFIALKGKKDDHHPKKMPYIHCFILIGQHSMAKEGNLKSQFNALNDEVLIFDPMLNHIGRANTYLSEQAEFLNTFEYQHIMQIIKMNPEVYDLTLIENNVQKLVACAKTQGIDHHKRALPITKIDFLQKTPCPETALLQCLNERSGITFFGVQKDYKVDAVAHISEQEDRTVEAIQQKLGAGCVYHDFNGYNSFFVLHDINVKTETENLPQRIHEVYGSPMKK